MGIRIEAFICVIAVVIFIHGNTRLVRYRGADRGACRCCGRRGAVGVGVGVGIYFHVNVHVELVLQMQ